MVPEQSATGSPAPGHALPPDRGQAPRSGALWIVLFVAAIAGLLAAWALWEARDVQTTTERIRQEVEMMRADMDSLRVELRRATDVFGPEESPTGDLEPDGS